MENADAPLPHETLACEMPAVIHPVCQDLLTAFADGRTTVHSPAYACNMVDSTLIPMVECLLKTYANGVLLHPYLF